MKKLFLLSMFFCITIYAIPEVVESRESEYTRREKEQEAKEELKEREKQEVGKIQQEAARQAEAARLLAEGKTDLPRLAIVSEKVTPQVKLPAISESSKPQAGIAVKTSESGKQPAPSITVKQQTVGDWVKDWQKFIYKPGKFTSAFGAQTGELYRLPEGAQAQALLEFVHAIPSGFFAEPTKALELLNNVLKEANSALEGSPDKAEHVKDIKDAITARAVQVIESGTFGKTPLESLNALKHSMLGNTIGVYAKLNPEATPQLEAAALRKSLSVVAESPIDHKGQSVNQLKALIDAFNKNLVEAPENLKTQEFTNQANKILIQKAAEALLKEPLRGNTIQLQFQNFLVDYIDIKKLTPAEANQEALTEVFKKRLSTLADSNQDNLKIAQGFITVAKNDIKRLSPREQAFTVQTINSLLLNRNFGEHALTMESFIQDYNKELFTINNYLKLLNQTQSSAELFNLPAAKRAVLLYEFLRQHEALLPENEKSTWERLKEGFKVFLSSDKGPLDIADRDPEFWQKYQAINQQELFASARLFALPEDIVKLGNSKLANLQKALAEEAAARRENKPKEELNALQKEVSASQEQLYKLRNVLIDPALSEIFPEVKEFIEHVDKIGSESNFNVLQRINKVESDMQTKLAQVLETGDKPIDLKEDAIITLEKELTKLADELKEISTSTQSVFQGKARLDAVQSTLDTWRAVASLARDYKTVFNPETSRVQLNEIYTKVADTKVLIATNFDYRYEESLPVRISKMKQQQQALRFLDAVTNQPVIVDDKPYTLRELNNYLEAWRTAYIRPKLEIVKALQEVGLISPLEQTSSKLELTDRGVYAAILSIEAESTAQRSKQLEEYVAHNRSIRAIPEWRAEDNSPAAQRAATLANELKLSLYILDDQLDVLKEFYEQNTLDPRRQAFYEILQQAGLQTKSLQVPINRERLDDLVNVLAALNKRNKGKPVDPVLQVWAEYQLQRASDPTKIVGEAFSESIMRLRALGSAQDALETVPSALREQLGALSGELGIVMQDTFEYISLEFQKGVMATGQVGSRISKIASPIIGTLTAYVTRKAAAEGMSGVVVTMVPGAQLAVDIVSLTTGSVAGTAIWLLANKIEPSREQLEALNKELAKRNIKTIEVSEGWMTQASKWAKEFIQTEFQNALDASHEYRKITQEHVEIFNSTKKAFYSSFELPETATFEELSSAINKTYKQINAETGLAGKAAGALKKRRIKNQLSVLISSAQRMTEAHQNEITNLSNIALQAISKSTLRNKSILADMAARAISTAGQFLSEIFVLQATKAKGQQITEFEPLYLAIQEFYEQQQADLIALKDALKANQELLKSASFLSTDRALKVIQDTLTSRMEASQKEYITGLRALLKEKGYSVSVAEA